MLFHFYNNGKYQSDLYFLLQLQLLNRFQHINQHYLHMYQLNFQLMHPPNQPTCQLTYQTIQIVRPTMQKMSFQFIIQKHHFQCIIQKHHFLCITQKLQPSPVTFQLMFLKVLVVRLLMPQMSFRYIIRKPLQQKVCLLTKQIQMMITVYHHMVNY